MSIMAQGITTTYPYEAHSPGVARHQCDECGKWERSDKGRIRHSKNCDSQPQAVEPAKPAQLDREIAESLRDKELRELSAHVRRTGMTKGRDRDVLDAVRKGYLSESDAMNTDD